MDVQFTDREIDVMEVLWERGPSLVAEVRAALSDELAYTTVLTILRTLEGKGYVSRAPEGRGHRYFAAVKQKAAQKSALQHLSRKLFKGSAELLFVHPSLARPGGNVTGINFFVQEVVAKRLRLLHDLLPKAVRIAVLLNPGNAVVADGTLRDVQEAAPTMGLQIQTILNASTIGEIDAAFVTMAHERADALFVAGDAFFVSQRAQLAALTARDGIPAAYGVREPVAAGGLMSYGSDLADMFHQVGVYTGSILKGAKPAELPVLQSTKFEFVINLKTARALGIEVPSALLLIADEVID